MKIGRIEPGRYVVVVDAAVYDITSQVGPIIGAAAGRRGDPLILALAEVMDAVADLDLGPPLCAEEEAHFLSPVERPTKIVAAPVNYEQHIAEALDDVAISAGNKVARIDEAGLFLKSASSLVGPSEGIAVRFPNRRTDHEIEVGVVIGRTCSNVLPADALDHVAGYAIALDVTLRGSEDRSFRKSIDTYSVLGPYLLTPDELGDPSDLEFALEVNGEQRQSSSTKALIKDIPTLIAWASEWYTLHPGDVLMTGTPEGVGPLLPGDELVCTMAGTTMRVGVRAAQNG